MNKFSTRSLTNLKGLHPDLIRLMHEAIKACPIDFTITEGVRTDERQKELYAIGRTKPGRIVTSCDGIKKKSNHQIQADGFGYAVDLYPFVNGKLLVTEKETVSYLIKIAAHIKQTAKNMNIKITWGGDWKTPYDPPHFELAV